MDYVALKAEITTDPAGLGYAALWVAGSDWQVAELLNAVRQSIDIWRGLIPSHEVIDVIVWTEWTGLSAANKQLLQTLTGPDRVNTSSANTRAAFSQMFAAGTATRTALLAVATRKGSRAEQLWGPGVVVTHDDVALARRES